MWRLICAATALSLSAMPALAQVSDEIVVTGDGAETLRNFVRDLSDAGRSDQLARWDRYLCSGVIGLSPAQASFVNERIEAAAALGKVRQGREGCRPNILIIVTHDAGPLARGFVEKFPNSLGRDGRERLVLFAAGEEPVRWISGSELLPSDGGPMIRNPGQPPQGRLSGSRLTVSARSVLSFMLVIVDFDRIGDVRLGPLADYLAMVAVARPPMGSPPPSQSVLSLFSRPPGERAARLTDQDRSYLAALYRSPQDQSAAGQRAAITSAMRKRANRARER
jgi:hypothetical protein